MSHEEKVALMRKVENLIGEHVEAFVFVARVSDDAGECVMHRYEGGRAQALGLMRQTQIVLETEIQDETRQQNNEEQI